MIDSVLHPLEWVVAWLMVGFHQVFTWIGLPAASGFTWALSIVGLVIVIRTILIPLFVKQIHASRRMQLIQPEMQKSCPCTSSGSSASRAGSAASGETRESA